MKENFAKSETDNYYKPTDTKQQILFNANPQKHNKINIHLIYWKRVAPYCQTQIHGIFDLTIIKRVIERVKIKYAKNGY